MGETRREALCAGLERSVNLGFHGANATSDVGSVMYRELEETVRPLAMPRVSRTIRQPCSVNRSVDV